MSDDLPRNSSGWVSGTAQLRCGIAALWGRVAWRHGVIFSGGSQEERCWGRVLGPHPPPGEAEEGAGFWQRESWAHLPVSLLSFTACFQGP